ncbi:glucosyltransferase domain-containing protein [Pseudochrobactrum saccharolyticum]|nr:glucosyltransferase domain-containing protein [Pseudochrobactrum saccharolyticum]
MVFDINSSDKRHFLYTLSFFLFTFFPLLTVGYYLYDDMGRSMDGYFRWSNDGRIISDIIFKVLMLGGPIHDISPLPQILAIATMSVTPIFLSRTFPKLTTFQSVISSILLFSTPFYLGNMSYVYDALPMSVSILFSLIALLSISKNLNFISCICASIFLFLSLSTYQASFNVFIVLFIATILAENRFNIIRAVIGAMAMIISLVTYKLSILFYNIGDYQTPHSNMASLNNMASAIFDNIYSCYSYLIKILTYNSVYAFIFSAALLVFIVVIIRVRKWNYAGLSLMLIALMTLAVPGIQLILQSPVFSARTMMGVGAVFCGLSGVAFSSAKTNIENRVLSSFSIALICCFVVISYGQAAYLRNVKLHQQDYIGRIAYQINRLADEKGASSVSIIGHQTYPLSLNHSLETAGFLKSINPPPVFENGWWSFRTLQLYGLNPSLQIVKKKRAEICPLIRSGTSTDPLGYQILAKDNTVVLVFNGACPPR